MISMERERAQRGGEGEERGRERKMELEGDRDGGKKKYIKR